MPSNGRVTNVKQLKKWVYNLLRNTRVLENRNVSNVIYEMRLEDDFYIVLHVNHLKDYLVCALENTTGSGIDSKKKRYFTSLDRLVLNIKKCAEENRALQDGLITRLLQLHTQLFNALLAEKQDINLCLEEWSKVAATAARIWGDHSSGK
jgi:hypothetical protein